MFIVVTVMSRMGDVVVSVRPEDGTIRIQKRIVTSVIHVGFIGD